MTLSKLSRRDFLKGAGATGMVGALALGGAGVAFAEEGTASGEAAATANPYSQALGEDASLLPMPRPPRTGGLRRPHHRR